MDEHQSGASRTVEREFESTLDSVDSAEEQVLQMGREAGFSDEELHRAGMAVREAMVNAVVHGNRYNLRKRVYLSLAAEPGKLSVVITDQGEGFEPGEIPDPLAEENLLRQSGRGLLLIQAFSDEFAMRRAQPPLGTEVHLVFTSNK